MNWISIDEEKCNGCKFCVVRCPRCFSKADDKIVGQADLLNCNICGHCIALCKPQAITHSLMEMNNFPKMNPDANFETSTFAQFIRNRRSHRHFKNKGIPQQDLETLIDTCRYAPTGSNVQTVEIVVLQDPELIKKLSDQTVDVFKKLGLAAQQQITDLQAEGKDVSESLIRTQIYGERLNEARDAGLDPIFHKAPVVKIFHSPRDSSAPKDNCVIASTTLSLMARTMGIESTYIGLFEIVARGNQQILSLLDIPAEHEIFSVLIMGYPRLKFHYQVDRKPIKVSWC
jgi:nitroreductase